jgi:hypothetical protein
MDWRDFGGRIDCIESEVSGGWVCNLSYVGGRAVQRIRRRSELLQLNLVITMSTVPSIHILIMRLLLYQIRVYLITCLITCDQIPHYPCL